MFLCRFPSLLPTPCCTCHCAHNKQHTHSSDEGSQARHHASWLSQIIFARSHYEDRTRPSYQFRIFQRLREYLKRISMVFLGFRILKMSRTVPFKSVNLSTPGATKSIQPSTPQLQTNVLGIIVPWPFYGSIVMPWYHRRLDQRETVQIDINRL